ncbi:copper resistance system multicopper oxidase [Desulfobacterium sp. N47]|uniref:Copper resistance protein A homolog n=1 Tax=uncultured Desulfobacterium sp. TaxID=201089 RepID=E1YAQ4_9BACT|nr:Copper resistance protein A homolog [uncultured Desulfobacterium sp.]
MNITKDITRRSFIRTTGAGLFLAGLHSALPLPAWALRANSGIKAAPSQRRYDLAIGYSPINIDGREGTATAINGSVPGPLIHLREGDDVVLNVTNRLMDTEDASIHWHGILLPFRMDGVPGVTFQGIRPGETYKYRFRVKQAGTYWYHSHSRFQEQTGTYGPLIIDPKEKEPFKYDRDYPVVLSDWSFEDPETIFRHINLMGDYYNFQRQTVQDFLDDVSNRGFANTIAERMVWGKMRMSPVDLTDVTAYTYTYLMNGHSPAMNWTAVFNPGETIRLRFINASATTNYDVRIPGLDMEIVMADGKAVRPVSVHEFRIGVAETYDVLIKPARDKAFTIFAESMDRSGYTRGTLSPESGMEAPVPQLRPRPVRSLEDIGMGGMVHGGMEGMNHGMHDEMGHGGNQTERDPRIPGPNGPEPFKPDKNRSNVDMVIMNPKYRLDEPGIGIGGDGWRVLTYQDLVSNEPQPYAEVVDREMTINITANMERYMFSFDGKKFSEHPGPYLFWHNERLRLFLVNHTMMEHPIHLHGMWMQLENGTGKLPFKHTLLVKPGEVLSVLITPVEKGDWAFHCHLLYHMEAGMFQVVRVA